MPQRDMGVSFTFAANLEGNGLFPYKFAHPLEF